MKLTFARTDHASIVVRDDTGTTIFTIVPSMRRGDTSVCVRNTLPGLKNYVTFDMPGSVSTYQTAESPDAREFIATIMREWIHRHVGVGVDIEIVDQVSR